MENYEQMSNGQFPNGLTIDIPVEKFREMDWHIDYFAKGFFVAMMAILYMFFSNLFIWLISCKVMHKELNLSTISAIIVISTLIALIRVLYYFFSNELLWNDAISAVLSVLIVGGCTFGIIWLVDFIGFWAYISYIGIGCGILVLLICIAIAIFSMIMGTKYSKEIEKIERLYSLPKGFWNNFKKQLDAAKKM